MISGLFKLWRRVRWGGPHVRLEIAALLVGLFTGFTLSSGAMYTLGVEIPVAPPLKGPGRGAGELPPLLQAGGWSEGIPLDWQQLRGRVVVLDVWALW